MLEAEGKNSIKLVKTYELLALMYTKMENFEASLHYLEKAASVLNKLGVLKNKRADDLLVRDFVEFKELIEEEIKQNYDSI